MMCVGAGRCGVEHHIDFLENIHFHQAVDAFCGRGYTHALSAGQAVGFGVDPYHGTHFKGFAVAHDLDHEVGADIA